MPELRRLLGSIPQAELVSVDEDREVELAHPIRVGQHLHRHDPAVDDGALGLDVGIGDRGTPDAPPGTTRQLPRCGGGAIDDRRDLVERHPEHVVKDERNALGRREGSSTTRSASPTESPRSASCSGSLSSSWVTIGSGR